MATRNQIVVIALIATILVVSGVAGAYFYSLPTSPTPSASPLPSQTISPTVVPTLTATPFEATAAPSLAPLPSSTTAPLPSLNPTVAPTAAAPTVAPTVAPTAAPTVAPTAAPTPKPTSYPPISITVADQPSYKVDFMPSEVGFVYAKSMYNISVSVNTYTSDQNSIAALQSGAVQFITEMPYVALQAELTGINMTAIYTKQAQIDSFLVVSTNSGIKTVNDLVGKTITVGAIGSGASWASTEYLKATYPQLNGTITEYVMASATNRAAAIIAGTIQATWVGAADLTTLAPYGIKPILSMNNVAPNVVSMCWYVMTSYKLAHPDIVQEMVTSLMQGYRDTYTYNDTFLSVVNLKLGDVVSPSDAQSDLNYYRQEGFMPANASPSTSDWSASMNYWVFSGILTQAQVNTYSYNTLVDPSFANNAQQQLGSFTIPTYH